MNGFPWHSFFSGCLTGLITYAAGVWHGKRSRR